MCGGPRRPETTRSCPARRGSGCSGGAGLDIETSVQLEGTGGTWGNVPAVKASPGDLNRTAPKPLFDGEECEVVETLIEMLKSWKKSLKCPEFAPLPTFFIQHNKAK